MHKFIIIMRLYVKYMAGACKLVYLLDINTGYERELHTTTEETMEKVLLNERDELEKRERILKARLLTSTARQSSMKPIQKEGRGAQEGCHPGQDEEDSQDCF